ncbi:MAG: hypothetical protein K0Q73_8344, partial [Paenibacillus sp.]|nr:hypothetical protein [Paenibacillus sp.]
MTASSQSQQVNEYIREVCSRVRAREVHPDIRAELTNHLEELSEDIKTHSPEISNEDAITTAIQQMGDPADVGSRLNRIHRPRTDWRFVGTVAALLGFALIIMYSADKSLQVRPSVQTIDLFSKKLLSIGIGLLLLVVVRMIDYRKISAYSVPIYWSTIVVMLFALMNGEHVNGTQQYITLLGIHFPLLALSPYVLIVVLAGLLTKQKNKHNWSVQWAVYVSPALVLYLLSFRITEFVFFFIVALALFMFTYRNKAIAVLAPLVHVFVIPALLLLFNGSFLQPGFRQRVSNFFNLDPYEGMVNPVVQSLDIIREAGWFGNGIGAPFTNMSLYYIHSDWIYTYMIFALGWAG